MTAKTSPRRIGLMVAQIASIALGVCAVGLLIYAFFLFYDASQLSNSATMHPNAAEDQPHGLDGLGAALAGGFGLAILFTALVLLAISVAATLATERRLRRLSGASMPAETPEMMTQSQATIPEPGAATEQSANSAEPDKKPDQS